MEILAKGRRKMEKMTMDNKSGRVIDSGLDSLVEMAIVDEEIISEAVINGYEPRIMSNLVEVTNGNATPYVKYDSEKSFSSGVRVNGIEVKERYVNDAYPKVIENFRKLIIDYRIMH